MPQRTDGPKEGGMLRAVPTDLELLGERGCTGRSVGTRVSGLYRWICDKEEGCEFWDKELETSLSPNELETRVRAACNARRCGRAIVARPAQDD